MLVDEFIPFPLPPRQPASRSRHCHPNLHLAEVGKNPLNFRSPPIRTGKNRDPHPSVDLSARTGTSRAPQRQRFHRHAISEENGRSNVNSIDCHRKRPRLGRWDGAHKGWWYSSSQSHKRALREDGESPSQCYEALVIAIKLGPIDVDLRVRCYATRFNNPFHGIENLPPANRGRRHHPALPLEHAKPPEPPCRAAPSPPIPFLLNLLRPRLRCPCLYMRTRIHSMSQAPDYQHSPMLAQLTVDGIAKPCCM